MTISDIKSNLTLSKILHHYHLKPDKNLRLVCPFHDDKTPSLQVYYKTHTAYCFSTNCKTNGKSLDVIDFIMHMENITKHEAILKAKGMINGTTVSKPVDQLTRTAVLTKMYTYFKNATANSKPAKEYIEHRNLSTEKTNIGYNSGQFHHGTRKDEALIRSCIKYGLLLDLGKNGRTGNPAYKPFGKTCVVFPLKNKQGQIVSLYFRSIYNKKGQTHYYLRDRQGLYPNYPNRETKKLILTESIIDAATLLEQAEIKRNYTVLALYGTNGLTEEHDKAINQLNELDEIIFFFDGDDAGNKSVKKYTEELKQNHAQLKITQIETPENEDVNSLCQSHSVEILNHLIEKRKPVPIIASGEIGIFSSTENVVQRSLAVARNGIVRVENGNPPQEKLDVIPSGSEPESQERVMTAGGSEPPTVGKSNGLDATNPYYIRYDGGQAKYSIKGFKVNQLDSLKVTLQIQIT